MHVTLVFPVSLLLLPCQMNLARQWRAKRTAVVSVVGNEDQKFTLQRTILKSRKQRQLMQQAMISAVALTRRLKEAKDESAVQRLRTSKQGPRLPAELES